MTLLLTLGGPLLAAALVALNVLIALRGPGRLGRMGLAVLRGIHRRAEFVELWRPPPAASAAPHNGRGASLLKRAARELLHTRLGVWAILASAAFLVFWLVGWVAPRYHLGFLWHLGSAWAAGAAGASLAFAGVWSVTAAYKMGRTQLFASRGGFSKLWMARACRSDSLLGEALREAFSESQRIEILDFTGFELIAKGPSEAGGVLANLLSRSPEKDVRILLFNPCAREVDPDRKHNTVLQSQLSTMEMSREAFESKLRASLDRIEVLNRGRPRPIEVRLYSEKPSFRVLAAGDVSFLGAIDPRDAAGEFPLYEARRLKDGPSLHAAARAHFARAWGDSVPVKVEAAATLEEPREGRVVTPAPRSRQAIA